MINKEEQQALYTARWAIANNELELAYNKVSEVLDGKVKDETKKPKLALVIGHTKRAGGAWAKAPISMNEYDFNTQIAELCKKYADEYGIELVVFTRDMGGIRGAYNRVIEWYTGEVDMYSRVNEEDGDVCVIELHFNSATPAATGTETLYDKDPVESKEFAKIVNDEIVDTLRLHNRKHKLREKGDRGYYNLEACKYPSCIVEPFFGSNISDCSRMESKKEEYAKALVRAAAKFMKE